MLDGLIVLATIAALIGVLLACLGVVALVARIPVVERWLDEKWTATWE